MNTNFTVDWGQVAGSVGLPTDCVKRCAKLLDDGNTVPFITRYRKDETGGLDEQQIRAIGEQLGLQRTLTEKKQKIVRLIQSQGQLTPQLEDQIRLAATTKLLDDLYLPFRPKKQTLATKARERGLVPLAKDVLQANVTSDALDARLVELVDEKKGLPTTQEVLQGVSHLLAEHFSEHAELRGRLRKKLWRSGVLVSTGVNDASPDASKAFSAYLDFRDPLTRIPPHRILAMNRGERSGVLRVKIDADLDELSRIAGQIAIPHDHPLVDLLYDCLRDALMRLIMPSLEREIRRELNEKAETHAIEVFARNLRKLLLQTPVAGHRVMAVDPGFRSGCKLAVVDAFGGILTTDLIHVVGSQSQRQAGREKLVDLITKHEVTVVAIGNGTACRESETLVADVIANELSERDVAYTIVNEAGASVYSTSELGREELPDLDATQRSAVSIGRRLLDPLSELVKINAANIGVGLYQHDIKSRHLQASLDDVVESCVNYVGVDLNTASPALLRYVSGLNQLTALRIYDHRRQHGPFNNRLELKEVAGIGDAVFVQAVGFLKIAGGDNPLDATWIHPESYHVAERILERLQGNMVDLAATAGKNAATIEMLGQRADDLDVAQLASELDVGVLSLDDILSSLRRPGRDPRDDLPPPTFRREIIKLEDLKPDMELLGTVLNVVDFGVFVDIGLHDSGLVHISRLADRFIRDAHDVVSVGDVLKVWVIDIDKERRRVALTAIPPGTQKQFRPPKTTGKKKPQEDRRPRQNRSRHGATSENNHAAKRTKKPKKKPPTVPITKAMEDGRAPMRTFGDLKQFYEKKGQPQREE